MKKRVELSTFCVILSTVASISLCGMFLFALKRPDNVLPVCLSGAAIIALFIFTLFFMPLSVSVDSDSLDVNLPLRVKSIPLSAISEVRLCSPTMGAKRIFGSGGWFGWYGWFSEKDLGKYFAYYGKASDCFLVTLKDGRKYMLGCKDAPEVVKTITDMISA